LGSTIREELTKEEPGKCNYVNWRTPIRSRKKMREEGPAPELSLSLSIHTCFRPEKKEDTGKTGRTGQVDQSTGGAEKKGRKSGDNRCRVRSLK